MTGDEADEFAQMLADQSVLIEPGSEMFILIHTGEEGMVPPPKDAPEDTAGHGSGHAFGPFVSREEAESWQSAIDLVQGECGCRRAVVPMAVPRMLGVIGPPAVPLQLTVLDLDQHQKDRRN